MKRSEKFWLIVLIIVFLILLSTVPEIAMALFALYIVFSFTFLGVSNFDKYNIIHICFNYIVKFNKYLDKDESNSSTN